MSNQGEILACFCHLPTTSHWYVAFPKSQVTFQNLEETLTTNLENENIQVLDAKNTDYKFIFFQQS